jgi:hypothetical protein
MGHSLQFKKTYSQILNSEEMTLIYLCATSTEPYSKDATQLNLTNSSAKLSDQC